jgi:hypothetical protein
MFQKTDYMRCFFFGFVSLFIMNYSYPLISNPEIASDTTGRHHNSKDSLICINYRMLPDLARYAPRYKILSSVNKDSRPININFSVQNFLKAENNGGSSLLDGYYLVNENMTQGNALYSELESFIPVAGKELAYGVWRNQLIKSSSENEIRQSITNGTNTLIDLGYSDLVNDFLPFITVIMEEQHIIQKV